MADRVNELIVRLLIDGAIVIPDAVSKAELAVIERGFERRAAELGKREMNWDDICTVPELMGVLCHPSLMAVVEGFCKRLGHEAVFANCAGARDVFDPKQPDKYEPPNLRHGNVGWHDDVVGMRNPNSDILPPSLTTLLYLDETFADNGAYCSAIGSHHLAGATADKKPILAKADEVLNYCELRPLPVKPGSMVVHRSHEWHGVVPPKQRRRLMLQTFTGRAVYDMQVGHTQVSDETLALIPEDRHKYFMAYSQVR
ncbi:MAG: phytanoyl-CoA dioxygenase family protein [Planctomycetes bacterium]|nr:phytanoyl-CoA dioxygenase family protein [Planctomycetota bacterium]